jgi:N-acetyl-alpha-D-muramate 1-phosphate uridylyltransferase
MITQAMILAAGLGKRLRPLTDTTPKPLVPVGGKTLLDHALDQAASAGITHCVINTHHLAGQIHDHVKGRTHPRITLSPESELLETGGGITKALPHFHGEPFFALNADIWWQDAGVLQRLSDMWEPEKMDALLLLAPLKKAIGYSGSGDYFLNPDGRTRHRGDKPAAPYIFSGIRILHPRLFAGQAVRPFSIIPLFHQAEQQGRLYGLAHEGPWGDIGTATSLEKVREYTTTQASVY